MCYPYMLGLHSKVLIVGGAVGMASVGIDQGLPPCQAEPVSDGFKINLLLPKAEPISDAGRTSAITFKKGYKLQHELFTVVICLCILYNL